MISVIIPAFNAAPFIRQAIASVRDCATDSKAIELIVVDHASTDETAAVALAALEAIPDIQTFLVSAPAGGGPARAKNVGFAASTGDLVTFLDADDVMVDLKARVEAIGSKGAVFARIAGLIDENGHPFSDRTFDSWVASCDGVHANFGRISVDGVAQGQLPGYFTLLYSRSLLERMSFRTLYEKLYRPIGSVAGPFDESLDRAEDFDLAYRCAREIGSIDFVDVPSVLYRVHGSNSSIFRGPNGILVRPETRAAHRRAMQKNGLA